MPQNQRRLIVNADDFGQSDGITRGILQAHDEGIVTSTSMMVRWPAAREAAVAAKSRSRLSVGLHVDLGEWRLAGKEWIPTYQVVAPDDAAAVAAEIRRQLDAFRRLMGREPTHFDSHQHVHRNEPAKSVLTALGAELEIPVRHFSDRVRYCGDFYGQDEDGEGLPKILTASHLIHILTSLSAGTTELACHPGFADDADTMYRDERRLEVAALCDPSVRSAMNSLDIGLCSFRDV